MWTHRCCLIQHTFVYSYWSNSCSIRQDLWGLAAWAGLNLTLLTNCFIISVSLPGHEICGCRLLKADVLPVIIKILSHLSDRLSSNQTTSLVSFHLPLTAASAWCLMMCMVRLTQQVAPRQDLLLWSYCNSWEGQQLGLISILNIKPESVTLKISYFGLSLIVTVQPLAIL